MKDGTIALNLLFVACLLSDILVPFLPDRKKEVWSGSSPADRKLVFFYSLTACAFLALPSLLLYAVTGEAVMTIYVFGVLSLHLIFCVGASFYTPSASVFSRRIVRAAALVAFDSLALAAGTLPVSAYDLLYSVLAGFPRSSALAAYAILAFAFPAMIAIRGPGTVRRRMETVALALSAFLLYALALRFDRPVDLTRERSYSLSPLTASALSGLESELLVTWYRSDLPVTRDRERESISGMLELYRRASGGKLSIEEVRVGPDNAGYPGMKTGAVVIPGGKGVSESISGFLLEYGGRSAVIPYLRDAASFEYTITRNILFLVGEEKPPMVELFQGSTRDTAAYSYLEDHLASAGLAVNGSQLDKGVRDTVVLVIGSRFLDESAVTSIRSRLDGGADAVFLVSGTSVGIQQNWSAAPKEDDALLSLLEELGVRVRRTIVLDPEGYPLALPSLDGSSIVTVPYVFWNSIDSDELPRTHPLFSGLESLQFFWPSPIAFDSAAGLSCLLKTGTASAEARPPFDTNPFSASLIRDKKGTGSGPLCLVASLERNGGQRLLFVSDELLPSSMIEYTGSRCNLDFIVNCVEWVSARDDLLTLKKRRRP